MLVWKKSLLKMLIFVLIKFSLADATKWLLDNPGFDNPRNWMSEYLPCPMEEVVFPEIYAAVLPLPKKVAVSGFILPREGALLLDQDSTINFGGEQRGLSCENGKSGKAYIKPANVRRWFSPSSWRADAPVNKALTDMERVPCNNEAVIIPRKGALAIDLENVPQVRLGELSLAGSLISRDYLSYLFKTDLGQLLFKNAASTAVEYYRNDICGCHKDFNAFVEPVCHNVVRSCERPHCLVPFTPHESCCAICGSSLHFTVEKCDLSSLNKLQKLISDAINVEDLKDELDFHVSYVTSGQGAKLLQAIVVDRHEYRELSVDFVQRLNATTNWTKLLSASDSPRLQVQFSGRPYNPDITFGSVLLIILCLLLVSFVGLVLFAQYAPNNRYLDRIPQWIHDPRRWRDLVLRSSFTFARFDNMRSEGGTVETDMQESIIMGYDVQSEEVRERAFDNPMFGEKAKEVEKPAEDGKDEVSRSTETVGKALGATAAAVDQRDKAEEEQELTEIKLQESSSDNDNSENSDERF